MIVNPDVYIAILKPEITRKHSEPLPKNAENSILLKTKTILYTKIKLKSGVSFFTFSLSGGVRTPAPR